jgi:hypothetical protein
MKRNRTGKSTSLVVSRGRRQFRDVVVTSSPMMTEPAMNGAMGPGHDVTMTVSRLHNPDRL